jgi:hypothetical protein
MGPSRQWVICSLGGLAAGKNEIAGDAKTRKGIHQTGDVAAIGWLSLPIQPRTTPGGDRSNGKGGIRFGDQIEPLGVRGGGDNAAGFLKSGMNEGRGKQVFGGAILGRVGEKTRRGAEGGGARSQ